MDATTRSAFDPSASDTASLLRQVGTLVAELTASSSGRSVLGHPDGAALASGLVAARPQAGPTEVEAVLDTIRDILATGVDNAAPVSYTHLTLPTIYSV